MMNQIPTGSLDTGFPALLAASSTAQGLRAGRATPFPFEAAA